MLSCRHRVCTWLQIPQVYGLLKEFRYVVMLDLDAYFAMPDIPLHLLLGHWGWQSHSRCAVQSARDL